MCRLGVGSKEICRKNGSTPGMLTAELEGRLWARNHVLQAEVMPLAAPSGSRDCARQTLFRKLLTGLVRRVGHCANSRL